MIAKSIIDTVGATPLIQTSNIARIEGLQARILVKHEGRNPLSSAKDRAVRSMLQTAVDEGKLHKGDTVVEGTSGNTGIALAYLCRAMGFNAVLTMPENMSEERKTLLRALGAKLILTPKAGGMQAAVDEAKRYAQDGAFMLSQFTNPANPLAHYKTTGPEIEKDAGGEVDVFVSGIGTGGTFSGTTRYLKERYPNMMAVAVEPFSSPMLSKGCAGPHKIQGIGANFVPPLFDSALCDRIISVTNEDAYSTTRMLMREEGIFAGISSGAAYFAALTLARESEFCGKTIVAVLPDTGERYLSEGIF